MKSVRPLCLAAALAVLLLAGAGPASADDGIHRLWEGFSAIGNPVFEMVESFWRFVTGTPDGSRTAVEKDGSSDVGIDDVTLTDTLPPPPGGGCVDPNGNPITCPTNPKP
jgi:hypothetical protein